MVILICYGLFQVVPRAWQDANIDFEKIYFSNGREVYNFSIRTIQSKTQKL